MDSHTRFPDLLKQLREERGLSGQDVANRIGVSPSRYSRIENGIVARVQAATILKIAEALELSEYETTKLLLFGRMVPERIQDILSRKPYLVFVLEDIDRLSDEGLQHILVEIEKLADNGDGSSSPSG
jgi:transcriptional regulator with XRE-family HTH domain